MDTVTQITLGAAVGEWILGRKIGNKAPLWGAVLGVVPDLDVLAIPFVSNVQALALHRGLSHSVLFCILGAFGLGWALNRLHRTERLGWQSWSWLVFWVLSTHVFIDVCTTYGTQILQPFSDRLFSLNSIFIIDPFYTLPMMAGVVTALFLPRESYRRRWLNYAGITVSSLYLLIGFGIKAHVNTVFEHNFSAQHVNPEQYMSTPTPFNVLLWTGYANKGDTLLVGLYSVLDDDREIHFRRIAKNEELIKPYREQLPLERLLWFSQGYYVADRDSSGELFMHDLRFGRSDFWLTGRPAPYVWNYRLQFNRDSSRVTGFFRFEPSFERRTAMLSGLLDRIMGEEAF
ncbi:metal-dependent hydrolase [Fodinibius sediminis]|uniref:Inner membrane protein n=1 Tax=Fodinibius sediminis TaxID=1214077 RepID=A0A521BI35_9BACT|nr:metal-dependent hydrolase [Fodinibius sediminis]SMO46794.1 inner membrane protein [Fodinibius sediminis]